MPEYLSPGVYVEEVSAGPRPIEGVSTSTAGFVGQTERGPLRPRLVTSWGDFVSWFGGLVDIGTSFLPFAARGFFDNGGQRLFVARVGRADAAVAALNHGTADAGQNLRIAASGPGGFGNGIFLRITAGTRAGVRMTFLYYREVPAPFVDPTDPATIGNPNRREPAAIEDYDNLGVQPTDPDYLLPRVNASSRLVSLAWTAAAAAARPNDVAFTQLAGGNDGAAAMNAASFQGNPAVPPDQRQGLAALESIDEISILSVPDEVNEALLANAADRDAIRDSMVNQCELLRDRFAVMNVAANSGNIQGINPPRDSSYAAIYYPWVRVFDPRTSDTLLVPPSGHVTGIYARTDVERGVHKAPANEALRGIVQVDINGTRRPLEFTLGKREHDILNPRGINVIRDFRADRRGIRVWGARTISSDPQWRYVNVRRLLLFIEESIDEGTQWVVFEPNDEPLWARVRQTIRNFLLLVWRSGALQGEVEERAFFVACDRTTMTQADIDAGRLICVIGVAPVKPAEFVIFRIQQITATEST
jgi:phage tail sheath protein FI